MAAAQRGEAVGAVLPRILRTAHAHKRGVEQLYHCRDHFFARHAVAAQVARDARPQAGQYAAEGRQPRVFVRIAQRAPLSVVDILLAAPRITPGRLQVPRRVRADPHFLVGRRNRQRSDACQRGGIVHASAVGVDVGKVAALAAAPDARHTVIDITQSGLAQYRTQRFVGTISREDTIQGWISFRGCQRAVPGFRRFMRAGRSGLARAAPVRGNGKCEPAPSRQRLRARRYAPPESAAFP
ncbi:hypothetical protein D9M72_425510 [compost metagenome]